MVTYLYTLILLSLVLGACSVSEPLPVAPKSAVHAYLSNWSGGSALVETYFRTPDGTSQVANGSVSGAGELDFTLLSVGARYLNRLSTCPNVKLSNADLKLNMFSTLTVLRDGILVGQLAQVSDARVITTGLRNVGDYYVQYTYANQPATVEGQCAVGGTPDSFAYDLELQSGWNLVTFKLLDQGVLELSTAPVPAEAAWFFDEGRP